jgi:hypothetical protein
MLIRAFPRGCLLFCIILFSTSCKKKEISNNFVITPGNTTNAFILTGDGYQSRLFIFNPDSGKGVYDTSSHTTSITMSGDTGNLRVGCMIQFVGNSIFPGLNPLKSPDTITISIRNTVLPKQDNYASVPKKTLFGVNTFEGVNGRVMGSFSGRFVNLSNILDTVIVANGRFSVTRYPDTH